jgi:pectinesterase
MSGNESWKLVILNAMLNRFLPLVLSVLVPVAFVSAPVDSSLAADSGQAKKIRIVLIGDSTVSDSSGWGPGFKELLTTRTECINAAANGRSTMSFIKEGRWTNALALQGDYYLIQFGHNNEPGKPGRSTDMPTFVNDMARYVDDACALGAKPVLVTPLTRRQWDKSDPGKIKSTLAPYAEEVKKIATEKKVPVVDLHARSIERCEKLGREACIAFSPTKVVGGTNTVDNTHLDKNGSRIFGKIVAEELVKALPELTECINLTPTPEAAIGK